MGIGDWGLGPIPKSPIPNPQSPSNININLFISVIFNIIVRIKKLIFILYIRYMEKGKDTKDANHIKIGAQTRVRNVITYATTLFKERNFTEVTLSAIGGAIGSLVNAVEVLKTEFPVYQTNKISTVSYQTMDSNEKVIQERLYPKMETVLSLAEPKTKGEGYQGKLSDDDKSKLKSYMDKRREERTNRLEGGNRGRGFEDRGFGERGFSRGGRGFSRGGRGFSSRGRGFGGRGFSSRGFSSRGRGFGGRGFSSRGRGFGDRGTGQSRGFGGRGFSSRGRGFGDRGRGQSRGFSGRGNSRGMGGNRF